MISGIDHINIETTDLAASVKFYTQLLCVEEGWRPAFDVPGSWLYVNERPIIHLVEREQVDQSSTGAIHHLAFTSTDFDAVRQRVETMGLAYDVVGVPGTEIRQIFVKDPNGIQLEFNISSA